jgi:PIN domain nuclease of toxin-antitoxin system
VILLDTHVAIWILRNDAALGNKARDLVVTAAQDGHLAISAISFWEIAFLIAKNRLRSLDDPAQTRSSILRSGIREIPLTGDIAIIAVQLVALHGDPADRFIAATAIAHNAAMLTADDALLNWRSRVRRINAER